MKDFKKKFSGMTIEPKILSEELTQVITEMILAGIFKPGERLVETELQKHFGVSRSPLREAFREVGKKGLVINIPRKGTFVKKITEKDIKNLFYVRAALEGFAARLSYPYMKNEKIAEMEKYLEGMKRASKSNQSQNYSNFHNKFHEIFIYNSRNELLIEILKNLRMNALWYHVSFRYHQRNFVTSISVHRRIFELFSSKDTDLNELENTVRSHLVSAYDTLFME